jgi:hypothetical protein
LVNTGTVQIAHLEQERKHDKTGSSDYEEGVTIIDTLVRKELCMMTKTSAFVICYCFLLHCFDCVFPLCFLLSSCSILSARRCRISIVLLCLHKAGVKQNAAWCGILSLCTNGFFEIDIFHMDHICNWFNVPDPLRCLVVVPWAHEIKAKVSCRCTN